MSVYSLDEHVPAGQSPWLAPDATIIGRVTMGSDVSVWFGAVLRGDNDDIRIGSRTNIQDGAIVHADPGFPAHIGEGCTIGHRAIVHGCTIGDGCLIGMGAIVLNGAVIGAHSVVGAGAIVLEGKVYPERSLIVGAPAKAIRTLTPEDDANLDAAAATYVSNAARFRHGLRLAELTEQP
ncbi:gamma carbonic anhydrase family protein [Ancylobacter polymorphus]|jgi:carbonic anhydrase/acetyltransferase-like protein (isoleucine patch superfamily)|uniref:Gamma carbonic anhydrase family protein n=1 Tax=Ancylobacter polymorphus TaxID=223390 RepID=A0A9E7D7C4_9HYPH|nr:gamma carbonic anhydrase family protein [Ancylobacter polymorphus]UOK71871.1 gamma carbonic anhydrase family protein [Ancylobacter polymorphus]